jgi:hypothetical protein
MAKRLQVILKDPEYRELKRAARSRQMSIAEWVRQALALAHRRESVGSVGKKLEVIRAAARLATYKHLKARQKRSSGTDLVLVPWLLAKPIAGM